MPLAANAVAIGNIEIRSDVVIAAEDCSFPSFDDMLVHHASICLYVRNRNVF